MILKQKQAAEVLGVTVQTIRNYERGGILSRVDIGRPGVWYRSADVAALAGASVLDFDPSRGASLPPSSLSLSLRRGAGLSPSTKKEPKQ